MLNTCGYFVVLLFTTGVHALFPDCTKAPLKNATVCDTSKTPFERAKSLVALYTLEEKINVTSTLSPGVPRLGIPAYQWWNEALHGIAGPYTNFSKEGEYSYSTSFPQPILMGAAFDDDLITQVAHVISIEARVFNNANRMSITTFTPNVNPFRDQRWGRGQEVPGEDPYHLSMYVKALVKGLQGEEGDPYKRVLATCKHYAGYDIEDWHGNIRFQFDAQISQQDLVEYYLPPFRACVEANVGAFMCSYNAVNGVPACADPYLLQTILREHWGWTNEEQWVTSDCDAIHHVYLPHEWSATREQAVADSLNAGTDLECGTYMTQHLPKAFKQRLVNETVLDRALARQYASLVRLGWFDPPEKQPYRKLGWDAVATNASQQLARKAATESIILLKNNGVLPLSLKSSVSWGLFGDWAKATKQLLGNYAGVPTYYHSPLWAAQQLNITVNIRKDVSNDGITNGWQSIQPVIDASDVLIYIGGIDNEDEAEGKDRTSLSWSANRMDVITQLAETGKPTIVVVMGGGQIDSSPLLKNPNISAILWAGYPGQDGGSAIMDILTGKVAPAGRLPTTQYPSSYNAEVSMTNMALRPGKRNPGRTYKWYNGTAPFEFGHGLHYTNFTASVTQPWKQSLKTSDLLSNCGNSSIGNGTATRLIRCKLPSLKVSVNNTGRTTSDYVALAYITGTYGPTPYPKKSLVAYKRLFAIRGGASATATLEVDLGALARVDESGNTVLYPGKYSLLIDNKPLANMDFEITGEKAVLDKWPQPPKGRKGKGVSGLEGYFREGFGSGQEELEGKYETKS